jgi:hypothetical protein
MWTGSHEDFRRIVVDGLQAVRLHLGQQLALIRKLRLDGDVEVRLSQLGCGDMIVTALFTSLYGRENRSSWQNTAAVWLISAKLHLHTTAGF